MIGLSTFDYDPSGCIRIDAYISNPYSAKRRGNVTATLDGGVSVYDTGYSDSDQVLSASIKNPSRALLVQLRYLVAYYGQVRMTCETGAYRITLEISVNNNAVNITMRVIARLDG